MKKQISNLRNGFYIAIFMSVLGSVSVLAHHSMATFDRTRMVSVKGRIIRVDWSNPHVYLFLEPDEGGGTWEIESQPPSILRRYGVTAESIKAGEIVTVSANPHRNVSARKLLASTLTREDGTTLDLGFTIQTLSQQNHAAGNKATSLAGNWVSVLGGESTNVGRQFIVGPSTWSLTEKGQNSLSSFSEEVMLPNINCVPFTAPFLNIIPDGKIIDIEADRVIIKSEFEGVERVAYFDPSARDNAEPILQGHSVARWDDDILVVDTTHFSDHRSGNAWGLASGGQKHLVERFELNEDSASLTYSFTLEDPEFMAAPQSGTFTWLYRPDLEFKAEPCDLDVARRFSRLE